MKFGKGYRLLIVPEWKKAYINYFLLKGMLVPFKIVMKLCIKTRFQKGEETVQLVGIHVNDPKIEKFKNMFENFILYEIDKFNYFFQYKLMNVLYNWSELYQQYLIMNCKQQKLIQDYANQQNALKTIFHAQYRQLKLLEGYTILNKQVINKLLDSYTKHSQYLVTSDNLNKKITRHLNEGYLARSENKLYQLINEFENVYLSFFFTIYNRNRGLEELKKISSNNFDQKNKFYFGIFTGFVLLLILLIVEKSIVNNLFNYGNSKDPNSFSLLFPIFRGIGLIILYQWLLAWNVYLWISRQVNYKMIFKFNHHSSTLSQILERASFFTFIYLASLICYLILKKTQEVDNDYSYYVQVGLFPLIVWVIFLGYIFFPSNKMFNPEGRNYFYNLLKLILQTPFKKMEFRIGWATDQLVSFIVPLKDLVTAILFYTCNFGNYQEAWDKTHNKWQYVLTGFIVASFPPIWRSMQCCRAMYDDKQYLYTNNFYNLMKYQSSLCTTILSFVMGLYTGLTKTYIMYAWILSSIISTLYSYYWDLKKDWGFFTDSKKNRFLRDDLCFGNPSIYYYVFVSNFILRCVWVFNISPDFQVQIFGNKDLFTFIIGFLEMFRRCQWNLFRVELEHVKNCTNFQAADDDQALLKNMKQQNSSFEKEDVKDNQCLENEIYKIHLQAPQKIVVDNLKNHFYNKYYKNDNYIQVTQDKVSKEISKFKKYLSQEN